MKHDCKVICTHHIYDCPLYSGCPPLKLILYNQSQVQEAINGLSHIEKCTEVLSFMGVDSSDSSDQSSSAAASSSKKGVSSKKGASSSRSSKGSKSAPPSSQESTFSYSVFEEEINNTCDYTCKMLSFPNRGSLRNLEDFPTDHGKFQMRPVSTFNVILGGRWYTKMVTWTWLPLANGQL